MMKSYGVLGLVMLLGIGGFGSVMGQEPDPAEIKRRMEIYMRDDPAEAKKSAPAPKPRPRPAPTVNYDHEAWKSAEKCGTTACFEAYLEDYPKGRYAKMARARLKTEPEPKPEPESRPAVVTERPAPAARPTNQRFTDNSDGTVTDNRTGLIWLKNANCFGTQDWFTAKASAQGLASGACGLHDSSGAGQWRLPRKEEWEALIDLTRDPALPTGHPFTGVQFNYYWSSTSDASTGLPWAVNLSLGSTGLDLMSSINFVWPVRDGR